VPAANADAVWLTTSNYINAHSNQEVKIDLSSLHFIDSAGVGLMIRAKKNAVQQGVKLHFVGPQPNVRNVLRIAKLESVLLGAAA
jgi:anti-anti-sigma factor